MPEPPELEGVKVNGWMAAFTAIAAAALGLIVMQLSPFASKQDMAEVKARVDKVEQKVEDLKNVLTKLGKIEQRLDDMEDPDLPLVVPKNHIRKDGRP